MRADLTMMVYLSFLLEERQSQLNSVGGQAVHTGFFFFFFSSTVVVFPFVTKTAISRFLNGAKVGDKYNRLLGRWLLSGLKAE